MSEAVDLASLAKRVDGIQNGTDLRPIDFADVVLGLLFITLADARSERVATQLERGRSRRRRSSPGPAEFHAHGAYYFPSGTRLADMLAVPGGEDFGGILASMVRKFAKENPGVGTVMNIDFRRLPIDALVELLKVCSTVRSGGETVAQEAFSRFLTRYALDEDSSAASVGHTPACIASLVAAVLDVSRGRVLDPNCRGADLLIAVAARARVRHRTADHLSLCGQTTTRSLAARAAMNVAAHRVEADIKTGRPLLDDPFHSVGGFEAVLVNPPFNEDGPDPRSVDGDQRFELGLPLTRAGGMKTANYLWIQSVRSALKPGGRGAILLPNSAADAGASELAIRRRLIEAGEVESVFSIGPNFYETGSNPVMLWFLRRSAGRSAVDPTVLFVDTRQIRTEVSRALNTWTPSQVEFLANIVRRFRGQAPEKDDGSVHLVEESFSAAAYEDVAGLCRRVTIDMIETGGWSLNPGRYVEVVNPATRDVDFRSNLRQLENELSTLDRAASRLRRRVAKSLREVIG